jgi:hypothetical protein
MDGVNVYLGLGIVLLLTAGFRGIDALGIPVPARTQVGSQILLAAAGVAAVVGAYTAPLPGTATEEIAGYRDLVRSSCSELRQIKASGDDAVLLDAKGRIDTVALLELSRRQSAQHDATLTALWAEAPPRSLRDDREEAIERSARSSDLLFDVLAHVEATLPRWATEADVDLAFAYRDQEAIALTSKADQALSDLAGEECVQR